MHICEASFNKAITTRFLRRLDKELYFDKIKDRKSFKKEVYQSLADNTYSPKLPQHLLTCDKGNGVLRFIPILSREDEVVYSFCVSSIDEYLSEGRVDGTFGGWLMSSVMRKKEEANDIVIELDDPSPCSNTLNRNAYISQFGEFNARIEDALKRCSDNSIIISLDIANFYNRIRLDLLEDGIRGVTPNNQSEIINCLFFFLRNWDRHINSFKPQSVGIPQEYFGDCSRILANFYLQPYDFRMNKFLKSIGGEYLRFADDQIIFAPKGYEKEIVAFASKQLMLLGLDINKSKVNFYDDTKSFLYYRGLSVLNVLDKRLSIKEQTQETIRDLTSEFLNANRDCIVKRGASILKTIIRLGLANLDEEQKDQLLSLIINEFLDVDFDGSMLKEMKETFSQKQWSAFFEQYSKGVKNETQSIRRFKLLKNILEVDEKLDWLRPDTITHSILK